MGRRKIEIKAIKDDRNRSVTFLKRKGGLFKKAHELSVLCSVDVAVFIFGSNKKLYEYSSGDMRELITRYTYHGGPNEHKGPTDFNGGEDDDDEDGDATPPHGHEGSVEPQMIPPHYQTQGQPPFPQLHGHAPSASPPINGVPFVSRGHTPQPQMNSRPSSRTDFRRPTGQHSNGYAYMPHPAIYNPQGQPSMSSMPHMTTHQPTQFPYPPPQHHQQPQPQPPMPQYMEDRRSSVPPPSYSQGPAQNQHMQRPQPSPPQPQPQQLPQQSQPVPHMSPPQPHLEPPQIHHHPPPPQEPQQPLPPMETRSDAASERPNRTFLDTTSAIKKLPQRKQHSIFTPIDENRSILSQHLESFGAEPRNIKDESAGGNRSQSVDVGAVSRNNDHSSPPPPPQRSNTSNVPSNLGPGLNRKSISGSIPETTFTPPSRSNSLRVGGAGNGGGGAPRPKLKVQIPDEASEAGSNTQESSTSPANPSETATQANRRNNTESHGTGPARRILSQDPLPQSQSNNNSMNIDTPVSALPSRFLTNELLPSPSTFYPEWNFRGSDSNTLPSPLNFATPVHGSGPSFLRDENPHKRKSPEINTAGPSSDGPEGVEAKRVRVDS
ncbi:MADS-box protein GGM13 [Apiospora kogelbergensis]|uniref:MADS-box protein GGM13 n=1 Tax=Apiospora kogelbergensis TaxID=1337665 RepID=UPI00312DED24